MEIDAKIARVKELIAKREDLDAELCELLFALSSRSDGRNDFRVPIVAAHVLL